MILSFLFLLFLFVFCLSKKPSADVDKTKVTTVQANKQCLLVADNNTMTNNTEPALMFPLMGFEKPNHSLLWSSCVSATCHNPAHIHARMFYFVRFSFPSICTNAGNVRWTWSYFFSLHVASVRCKALWYRLFFGILSNMTAVLPWREYLKYWMK